MSSHEVQLTVWKRCIYQTAMLPIWQLISALLYDYGARSSATTWAWEMGLHTVMLLHLSTASFAILALYLYCREHELMGLNVVMKFLALKSMVFGHAVNKIGIAVYTSQSSDDKVLGAAMLGGLTLLQAELLAIIVIYVYPASDPALEEAFLRQPGYTKVAASMEEASKTPNAPTAVSEEVTSKENAYAVEEDLEDRFPSMASTEGEELQAATVRLNETGDGIGKTGSTRGADGKAE